MDHWLKMKENKKWDKYLDLAGAEKSVKHEHDCDTNCRWCTWNGPQGFGKEIGKIGNKRKNPDHLDHSIVKIR